MPKSVQINAPAANGNPADILIDGKPTCGVTGLHLDWPKAHDLPRLTLELAVHPIEFNGEVTDVRVSDRARETLIRFGWAPPDEPRLSEEHLTEAAQTLGISRSQADALARAYFGMAGAVTI